MIVMGMPPQKHVIDSGPTSFTTAAKTSLELVKGVLNPDYSANPTNVRVGSIVTGMLIQIDVCPDEGSFQANPLMFDWYICYNIDGQQTAQLPNPGLVGSSDLMGQIFHEDGSIIMLPTAAQLAGQFLKLNSWRLYVHIPKGYQKLMRGDLIQLVFKTDAAIKCWIKVKVIYKEIYP